MSTKAWLFVAISLVVLAMVAFLGGRELERQAVAAKILAGRRSVKVAPAEAVPAPSDYRQLGIVEILSLPFPQFYESLRAAPREARDKWIAELEKMPISPKRSAAEAGFYKLLVQFDPVTAAKAVGNIHDPGARGFILEVVVNAAPTFALPDMAKLLLQLTTPESRERRLFADVMNDWSTVDPAAAAQFLEEHPESGADFLRQRLVMNWATVDPSAAKSWLERHPEGDNDFRFLIQGWYLNDRTAAVAYALARPQEAGTAGALKYLLSALYVDSPDEAKDFLESLPNDDLRWEAFRDFGSLIAFPEEEPPQRQTPPRALADWITQFPPSYWQGALTNVLRQWSFESPQDVVAWITLQPAQVRDAVAAEFAYYNYATIDEAVRPILQIADPSLRERLLRAMFQHMEEPGEDVARAVEQSSLGSSEKQQVLTVMQQVLVDNEASPKQPRDQGREK